MTESQGVPPGGVGGGGGVNPVLVGSWVNSESMGGGDAFFSSRTTVTFNHDGTYIYQDGPAYFGGNAGSIDGGAGESYKGNWQMKDDLLYTKVSGSGQWVLLGRIYIEGQKALVYNPDGSRTVWNRQ